MPTLVRFLSVLGLIVGGIYAGMLALVTLVQPEPRELVQIVELPHDVTVETGRSVATRLDREAAILSGHARRRKASAD